MGGQSNRLASKVVESARSTDDVPEGAEVPVGDTEIHSWFERDRAHVELRHKPTEATIVEWWDASVYEAIQDGFLSGGRGPRMDNQALLASAYEYASEQGLLNAGRFYKDCQIKILVARKTLAARCPNGMSAEDEKRFLECFEADLKHEMAGATVSVEMAGEAAGASEAFVQDNVGKRRDGLAEKLWEIFDRLLDDTDQWVREA